MSQAQTVIRTIGSAITGGTTTLVVTANCTQGQGKVRVHRLTMTYTSGSAVTYRPRLGNVAAFVADSFDEKITEDSTAVATRTNKVYVLPVPIRTDASGNLYFRPTFSAGSDNVASWEAEVEIVLDG